MFLIREKNEEKLGEAGGDLIDEARDDHINPLKEATLQRYCNASTSRKAFNSRNAFSSIQRDTPSLTNHERPATRYINMYKDSQLLSTHYVCESPLKCTIIAELPSFILLYLT